MMGLYYKNAFLSIKNLLFMVFLSSIHKIAVFSEIFLFKSPSSSIFYFYLCIIFMNICIFIRIFSVFYAIKQYVLAKYAARILVDRGLCHGGSDLSIRTILLHISRLCHGYAQQRKNILSAFCPEISYRDLFRRQKPWGRSVIPLPRHCSPLPKSSSPPSSRVHSSSVRLT